MTTSRPTLSTRDAQGATSAFPRSADRSPGYRWLVLAALALLVGTFSLRYLWPGMPLPAPLPNVRAHPWGLVTHATLASVALLIAPWQLRSGLRHRRPRTHRLLGRVYAMAVCGGGAAALWIAPAARGGLPSTLGFGSLGVLWLTTTALGLLRIRQGRVAAHRRWMIRSAALTFAALTLRIYIPAAELARLPFETSYIAISWLCWVPNLLAAEVWLRCEGALRSRAAER